MQVFEYTPHIDVPGKILAITPPHTHPQRERGRQSDSQTQTQTQTERIKQTNKNRLYQYILQMPDSHTLVVSEQLLAEVVVLVMVQGSPGTATAPYTERKQTINNMDMTNTMSSSFYYLHQNLPLRRIGEGQNTEFMRLVLLRTTFKFVFP